MQKIIMLISSTIPKGQRNIYIHSNFILFISEFSCCIWDQFGIPLRIFRCEVTTRYRFRYIWQIFWHVFPSFYNGSDINFSYELPKKRCNPIQTIASVIGMKRIFFVNYGIGYVNIIAYTVKDNIQDGP